MMRLKLRIILATATACLVTIHVAAVGHIGHKSGRPAGCGEVIHKDVTCKVCKPLPDKKNVTKVVYECKEEWYCLPKCPCPRHIGKHDCCDPRGTPCPTCEKPRCRRVLVKKFVTEEKPTTKCVIEPVSAHTPSRPN